MAMALEPTMLQGRTALVTGSVGGIGHATARALAQRGCAVMVHGLADRADGEAAARRVAEDFKVKAAFSDADLAQLPEIERLVAETEAKLGPIDILVNNAVFRHAGPVETFPVDKWDQAVAVNLSAPFHLIRLTLGGMKARRWGRIVNLASNWGLTGTTNRADYVATKHGLVGLTRAVALETLPFGVTCNAVAPGATLTPNAERQLQKRIADSGKTRDEVLHDFFLERQPAHRFVMPEDVGELIAFLCSDAAREMTGSPISIDGGWLAQ
jgi:3-hydroxybutyrate dehydrogenase